MNTALPRHTRRRLGPRLLRLTRLRRRNVEEIPGCSDLRRPVAKEEEGEASIGAGWGLAAG